MKTRPKMPVTITPDEVTMNNLTITEIKYLMNLMMGDYHSTHSSNSTQPITTQVYY